MRPGGLSSALLRAHLAKPALIAALALVLSLLSFPAVAASKTIPSCSRLPRKALADLAQTGPLKLERKGGNLCLFFGKRAGQYKPQLGIQIIPYIKTIWKLAESDAQRAASKNGSYFGRASSKLFFVSGAQTDQGLPTCSGHGKPGKGGSEFAPACSPEPSLEKFNVIGNGTDKRGHVHLMVTVALSGQQGDVHLSHVLELVKEIISGKIH